MMTRIVLGSVIMLLVALAIVSVASADHVPPGTCVLPERTHADMREWLSRQYTEEGLIELESATPVRPGVKPIPPKLAELWVNRDGGTWTLVLMEDDGCAKAVAAGSSWRFLKKQTSLKPVGEDA